MKLGWHLGYWGATPPHDIPATLAAVEAMGYDSAWTSEAYGSDALTPLAWFGSVTTRLRLGTSIAQLSARTPTATAMAAMTLDHLSEGRFALGLGVSGPQIVEGWYGAPFPRPLARTREYVDVVRQTLAREDPVASAGPHYPLPHPGGTGLGKPLRLITHPRKPGPPILLAAEGPRNVELAAEIADGWLPILFSPTQVDDALDQLRRGWSRPGARRKPEDFEILPMVSVAIDDDVEAAADRLRPAIALYVGGMGAKSANFHFEKFCRLGYEREATRIQDLFLAGSKGEAVAAVTTAMVEEMCLVGPKEKIRDDLAAWQESPATTLLVSGDLPLLRTMAELVL
ncbi:LLM class F420-dependent oxidoreductase [Nocardioides panzhihuensis]|uniref:F420-dependent oxidoreductase-like protein n=1 Tax=Nocardioides panzhihuensis TaxID=860243 RepID=A0A7Z0DN25_9ACTN|nr:LLM class F420-dependent oxidoreductase [Nocardioides panzhihuensis]NYI78279.1 F420-dependent oxidoreductase-like protein [Nocardioides panzhihuensis]